jgi:hypothetical protein
VSESVLGELISVLDLVVLERHRGGSFVQLGDHRPPRWFVKAFDNAGAREDVTLLQAFPILDSFLSEAELFWERTSDGRLEGEAFVVTSPGGENLPLVPIAVATQRRQFLILQRVAGFDEKQRILQTARDRALEYEQVVKRIDSLNRPLTTLLRLAEELRSAELSEAARKQAAGINEAAVTLRTLLDQLPQLPRAATTRPR